MNHKIATICRTEQALLRSYNIDNFLNFAQFIDDNLGQETIDRIERGNLNYDIYAKVFVKASVMMTEKDTSLDEAVNNILDDPNTVIGMMKK